MVYIGISGLEVLVIYPKTPGISRIIDFLASILPRRSKME